MDNITNEAKLLLLLNNLKLARKEFFKLNVDIIHIGIMLVISILLDLIVKGHSILLISSFFAIYKIFNVCKEARHILANLYNKEMYKKYNIYTNDYVYNIDRYSNYIYIYGILVLILLIKLYYKI